MNKVRKLAEGLAEKYPNLFSTSFDSNKQAVGQVMVIRNRAVRNQLAGAITVIMKERAPKGVPGVEEAPETNADQESGAMATAIQEASKEAGGETSAAGEQVEQPAQ